MRLLLDAHIVLWWLADDESLGPRARKEIEAPDNWVGVSAATVWEIEIKRALGKLEAPSDLVGELEANDLEPLSVSVQHAAAAAALPRHHDDPFDRMLVAQASAEGLTIVTSDDRIPRYGVPVLTGSLNVSCGPPSVRWARVSSTSSAGARTSDDCHQRAIP